MGVPDAGNCFVGLEEFGNHLHRVEVQVVASEAAKWGHNKISSKYRSNPIIPP